MLGTPPDHPAGPRIWLYGTVTLTLGAFAAAIVLAPPASAGPGRGLAWLLFVGSSVHVASTGWLYTLPEVRGSPPAQVDRRDVLSGLIHEYYPAAA